MTVRAGLSAFQASVVMVGLCPIAVLSLLSVNGHLFCLLLGGLRHGRGGEGNALSLW